MLNILAQGCPEIEMGPFLVFIIIGVAFGLIACICAPFRGSDCAVIIFGFGSLGFGSYILLDILRENHNSLASVMDLVVRYPLGYFLLILLPIGLG